MKDKEQHPEALVLIAAIEVPYGQLANLEETIGDLNSITMSAPRTAEWDKVRDEVSCLDSIADVMRQALDSLSDESSLNTLEE